MKENYCSVCNYENGVVAVPRDADGELINLGMEVYPVVGGYEFKKGFASGYGYIGNEWCVYVADIKGGYCYEMWCSPRKLRVNNVTVEGLLRDYVAAAQDSDDGLMRKIESMLEVKNAG